ncbi:hypothetical protein C8J55DRAFT_429074 [Lentinula edodes]|uniref:Uncharacterized protein n=1 Tax=Lentinula lateritia TaxID=40482 RepID=A0A9W9DPK1_9AGAR|nr:hypothetical protein C8J55DRAFT_429074 [Lentinula edodes]
MTSATSLASLPVELVEQIITSFWSQHQSTHHRATFMKSSLCVSRSWAILYMRAFCQDVHIPSGEFALKFLEILRNESPVYSYFTENGTLFDRRCRSLTFQRDNEEGINSPTPEHPMGLAIYTVLRFLYFSPHLIPNLRRISLLFSNSTMSDLFTRNRFIGFPTQVTELNIRFTYGPRTSKDVLKNIARNEAVVGLVPGSMKRVRVLRVTGLTKSAVRELVLACVNRESVETEDGQWTFGRKKRITTERAGI